MLQSQGLVDPFHSTFPANSIIPAMADISKSAEDTVLDIIIVGGGTAGMTSQTLSGVIG